MTRIPQTTPPLCASKGKFYLFSYSYWYAIVTQNSRATISPQFKGKSTSKRCSSNKKYKQQSYNPSFFIRQYKILRSQLFRGSISVRFPAKWGWNKRIVGRGQKSCRINIPRNL